MKHDKCFAILPSPTENISSDKVISHSQVALCHKHHNLIQRNHSSHPIEYISLDKETLQVY